MCEETITGHSWPDFLMSSTWIERRNLHHCGSSLPFKVYEMLRIMETAS